LDIRAYALVGFCIISLLFTQYAFAQLAGCGPDEVRDITGECVSAFDDSSLLTISTDKSVYKENEVMYVTYVISERIPNEELSIRLYDPNGDNISSTIISDYGLSYQLSSYTTFFPYDRELDDGKWYVGGVYTIIGEYAGAKTILTVEVIISPEDSTIQQPITVSTDRTTYNEGDIIRISGNVGTLSKFSPVSITIIDPSGEIVAMDQKYPYSDGSYSTTITAGGTMQISGDYTITAQYGLQKATTTFYFVGTTTTPPTSPNTVFIALDSAIPGCEDTNECFIPAVITVNVGDTIKWENKDSAAHTVTSGFAASGPDGHFDSNLFMSGQTFSWTAKAAGEYPYFDITHPWMAGVVIVKESTSGIVDTVPPLLLTPSDMTIDAIDSTGARVDYSVKATDDKIMNESVPLSLNHFSKEQI